MDFQRVSYFSRLKPAAKKERARGERNGAAKLTEDDVRQIRRLYKPRQNTGALAVLFDVDESTIYRIVTGIDWGWLK